MDETTQAEGRVGDPPGGRVAPLPGACTLSESEFIAVVEHCSNDLCGFFRRRGLAHADCKDRVQECFEVLWRRRNDVDPARARGYLFGIARNLLSTHWRNRMREVALSDVQTFPEDVAALGADEGMERAERLHRLYGILESLPPRQREVLELVYGLDFSIAEAARRLGVSDATARTHHTRALKSLAERIQRDFE